MSRGQGDYKITLELTIKTPGCPLKAAIYDSPNHTDDSISSDLDTWDNPVLTRKTEKKLRKAGKP